MDNENQLQIYENLNIDKIMQVLPHRYPMLLVDRVLSLNPHKEIRAYKNVTINEEVFLGHFPKEPIYPGVMIIEGMAQAGGILAFVSTWGLDFDTSKDKVVYFMTIDNVKFRVPVRPGDRLTYHMEVMKQRSNVWQLQGRAYVDDSLVSEAELKAMVTDSHNK
ncbi:3-hydroxyacyl-ACP dehydratase FabZ [Helicobacter bilis]|uniref:3-hydroxyacyl-ACP dehydratase FabZ n=1 Tax=Helicobacter bilis TaxID=37372 RepID=UPI0026ED86DA|nr:3-hydroxyacyl-ACP dehydratase FabZ [Helicobacter bilis]MCI7411666.1 3-hydroxyacyl-ACP dehydratase FabZ [Helicobacter bilis]MDD7296297.1 3-hydroxyacyl-ACP dehydratase FabZ [Helicobacter bilis]MDY4400521.1 3-hydroxyacyl-ACP dehydratase FabZ [Helicobacter bilis]